MPEKENLEIKKFSWRPEQDGKYFIISGTEEQLWEACKKLFLAFGEQITNEQSTKEYFLSGQELRPMAYAIRYDIYKGQLIVDARNAMNDQPSLEKFKHAVTETLSKP